MQRGQITALTNSFSSLIKVKHLVTHVKLAVVLWKMCEKEQVVFYMCRLAGLAYKPRNNFNPRDVSKLTRQTLVNRGGFKARLQRERERDKSSFTVAAGLRGRVNNLCTEENFAAEEWRIRYRACRYTMSVAGAATDDNNSSSGSSSKNDDEADEDGEDDDEDEGEEGGQRERRRKTSQARRPGERASHGHAGES